jgi:hypothetical protein
MTATSTPGTRIDHYEIMRLLGQGGMLAFCKTAYEEDLGGTNC